MLLCIAHASNIAVVAFIEIDRACLPFMLLVCLHSFDATMAIFIKNRLSLYCVRPLMCDDELQAAWLIETD